MSGPIVFISHFRIKEGRLGPLRELAREITDRLDPEKPRTLVYLSYVDEDRGTVSFLHAFGDADSMDAHFEGSDERSRAAYELMEPAGWEIYGLPNEGALEVMRQAAASGATLTVAPEWVAGFLRPSAE